MTRIRVGLKGKRTGKGDGKGKDKGCSWHSHFSGCEVRGDVARVLISEGGIRAARGEFPPTRPRPPVPPIR